MFTIEKTGGACNTRPTTKSCRDNAMVVEAGVDTARALFRLNRAFNGGEHQEKDALHMRFFPSASVVAVEGHPDPDGLAHVDLLPDFVERCAATFGLGAFIGFSRLDSTATLAFDHGWQGRAFLDAMAAVQVPYLKPSTIGNPIETVYWLSKVGRGAKLARAYDKGIESGAADPGELIRLENQARYKTSRRPLLAHVDPAGSFKRRFEAMAPVDTKVTVSAALPALDVLEQAYLEGRIKEARFTTLAGHLLKESRNVPGNPRTRRDHRQKLRELGIAVSAQADPDAPPVDVSGLLAAAIDPKVWA